MPETKFVRDWNFKNALFVSLDGPINNITAIAIDNIFTETPAAHSHIYFIINTNGGDFFATRKIRAALDRVRDRLTTVVFGKAFSGGLSLLQAGKNRIATRKSRLKFHQASYSVPKNTDMNFHSFLNGFITTARIDAVQLIWLTERGRPVKKIFELFGEDALIGADRAKKLRLIDEIVPEQKNIEDLISFLSSRECDK